MVKVRKITSLVIAFLMLTAVLAGCKPGDKGKGGTGADEGEAVKPTEVVFWFNDWGAPITKANQEVVNSFNEKHKDIKVKMQTQPFGGSYAYSPWDHKFLPAVAAGTAPDIYFSAGINGAVKDGIMADITDYLAQNKEFDINMYYDFFHEDIKYNGRIYTLPYEASVIGFMTYNKTMFKKAGFDPNVTPKNYEEFDHYVEKMTLTDTNGDYTQVGFIPYNWLYKDANYFFLSFGGGLWDEGKITPTHEGNIRALEWMQKFVQKYGYEKINKLTSTLSEPYEAFKYGVVGMNYSYNGLLNTMLKSEVSFEWGVARFPSITDDVNPGTCNGWAVGVTADSKVKAEAVKYMVYHFGKEGQMILMKNFEKGILNSFSPVIEVNQYYMNNWDPVLQFVATSILPQATRKYPNVSSNQTHPKYHEVMNTAIMNVIESKGEPRQELENAKNKIEQMMAEQEK